MQSSDKPFPNLAREHCTADKPCSITLLNQEIFSTLKAVEGTARATNSSFAYLAFSQQFSSSTKKQKYDSEKRTERPEECKYGWELQEI